MLRTFKADTLTNVKRQTSILDIDIIGWDFIHSMVLAVFEHIGINCFCIFLRSQCIILIRHTDIPQDVLVPNLGYEHSTGQLCIVIVWPLGNYLELLFFRVKIHLELSPIQLSTLESNMLDQAPYFIVIRVKRQ